ncbi:hypothetical protein [Phaffia rhodozyma]|uniref:Uncharacterized protein n=1 Tax=Phaffia rhodozyma TaxID=264483 RepID=A0A0F7SX28_PHARH|nr:hypothetical protein [Phaffia rhodozyma]
MALLVGNLTVDDFDSLLSYADQTQWSTPNPQLNPGWFNDTSQAGADAVWHEATWHKTNVPGASVAFNFTGSSLYVWGATGPTCGSYQITLDGNVSNHTAYNTVNGTDRFLLYGASNLSYSAHELTLQNLGDLDGQSGGELLLDLVEVAVAFAGAGGTATNVTLDETSSQIVFNGTWGSNTGPYFWGNTTTYTNQDGASFNIDFQGTAIYIFGDQVNDHGFFTVTINETSAETLNNESGCGGGFAKTCEKLGTLAYFKGNLGQGTHRLKLVNNGGSRQSYFDMDRIVITQPSIYPPIVIQSSTSTTTTSSSSSISASKTSGATSPSASSSGSNAGTNGADSSRQGISLWVGSMEFVIASCLLMVF